MTDKKVLMALVVVAIIAIGGYFFPKFLAPLGIASGPTHTEAQEFLGGVSLGLVNSTTTTLSAYTMVANDLASARQGAIYDTLLVTKTVGVSGGGNLATTTYTYPASSTMPHVLPRAGQRATQCWLSATSSEAQLGFILAAGTGFDFQTASTTRTDLTVAGGAGVCLEYIRQADSDISVLIRDYMSAD